MTIDLTTLPARLRGKRGERTLYAVSVETGVSVPTLSRIERGSLPQGTTLAALEQWLDGYELGEPDVPVLHVAIDRGVDELRRQLHVAVQSWQDVHRLNTDLQALVNQQRGEIDDLRAARRAYAKTLTDIRGALGAVDDADLVEVAQKTVHVIEQTDLFRQRHIAERDRALAECERLRAGIALARAYKAAVDGLNGVADAEAALFAWLGENDHVPHP